MVLAQVFTLVFGLYALIGCAAAAWLLALGGLARIEPKAAGASIAARVLWFPACLALWPVLIKQARRAGQASVVARNHDAEAGP